MKYPYSHSMVNETGKASIDAGFQITISVNTMKKYPIQNLLLIATDVPTERCHTAHWATS